MPSKKFSFLALMLGTIGHSIRVEVPQRLLAFNSDPASVIQAGGWKSAAMPTRYGGKSTWPGRNSAHRTGLMGMEFALPMQPGVFDPERGSTKTR